MRRKKKQIWVDPAFSRLLKKKALEKDMMILPFTKKLAKEEDFDDFIGYKRKKRKRSKNYELVF